MPPLIYPQLATQLTLQQVLNQTLSLRLYANNRIPQVTDTPAMYTEVSGGGYAAIPLTYANWTITAGSPSIALYNAFQDFAFTGVPDGSGVVYGYFILTAGNLLLLAERFFPEDVPYAPGPGKHIQIRPRVAADNLVPPPIVGP
jgi:hypothetical protein